MTMIGATLLFIVTVFGSIASGVEHGAVLDVDDNKSLADFGAWSLSSSIQSRKLQEDSASSYYFYEAKAESDILGKGSPNAAIGNPLKGLLTSPRWTDGNTPNDVPSSLEFYYIGLDEVMIGYNQFNWTTLDQTLVDAAQRSNHVIWRVFCHYPGHPLRLPQYLIDAGVPLFPIRDIGISPQYDDSILLEAFQQLIGALGQRYDGHKSLAFIQLGLLGYWGEWHTYPENGLLSESTMEKIVAWYAAAFKKTRLQCRTSLASVFAAGIGLHDDSFAHSTLGTIDWFFWTKVERAGQTAFWKTSVMGGETRPELQGSVFQPTYNPGSDPYKQDFMTCVNVTHATYMIHHGAFMGTFDEEELINARRAHARMGYNFQVTSVGVQASDDGQRVSVDIVVRQTGVAPFYYPLSLALSCPGTMKMVGGVETLLDGGDSGLFRFTDIPADATCLQNVRITLESEYAYPGRPIKFAQGKDGEVLLQLPLPPTTNGGLSTSPDDGM